MEKERVPQKIGNKKKDHIVSGPMFWQMSLFFVAAHVAYECTLVARAAETNHPLWWFPVLASTSGVLAFCRVIFNHRNEYNCEKCSSVLFPLMQIVSGVVAGSFGVFRVFATAYTATTLILVWIYGAGMCGLVKYDEREQHFLLSCSTAYAVLRCVTEVFVLHLSLPRRLGRLVPLGVATFETGVMLLSKTEYYRFPVWSFEFTAYATLKSAVFISLPPLEEWLLGTL